MPPTILITRPEASAARFADQVRARFGCDVNIVISPVLEIEFLKPQLDLAGFQTLIFTSRNAVEAFASLSGSRDLPCYVVGQVTRDAAMNEGFEVIAIGADVDALCTVILERGERGPCLYACGTHVAGDLMGCLTDAGVAVEQVILYEQHATPLSAAASGALSADAPVILPLFSPRTARIFFERADTQAPLFVAALSENVAKQVPIGAATRQLVADRPDLKAMLDAIDKLLNPANQLEGTQGSQ